MRIVPENRARVKVGDKSGRLTVIGSPFYARVQTKQLIKFVVCECECGNISAHYESVIARSVAKSCGCYGREVTRTRSKTHGESKTRLYAIWKGMHKRCANPKVEKWMSYGGKGVLVCGEWSTFEPFRDWAMEHGYSDLLTIERDKIDRDYCPGNCRWIPSGEQAKNTSRTRLMTAFGETKCLSEWYRDPRAVVCKSTLEKRIIRGLDLEFAMTTPSRENRIQKKSRVG